MGWALAVGAVFLLTRLAGLLKANELEDQDSIGFILRADVFRTLNFGRLMDMDATVLPLYSMLTAVVSLVTSDYELAARMVSLLASCAAALAAALLAVRYGGYRAGIATVAILAVNPYLIRFSYSVVSEPLYSAIFAWTLLLFVRLVEKPTIRTSVVLGLLGGLAFATRFESILLFVLLPILLLFFTRLPGSRSPPRPVAIPILVYSCVVTLLLAPQIWRVSEKMTSFGLNGRTVYQATLNSSIGDGYKAKLFGLDFDPATKNVHFLMENPDRLKEIAARKTIAATLADYVRKAIFNLEALVLDNLPQLTGIFVFAFSIIGFLAIMRSAQPIDAAKIAIFLMVGLAAPLTNKIVLDHIALIAAPLAMLAGVGLADTAASLGRERAPLAWRRDVLLTVLIVFATAPFCLGLYRLYSKPDDANRWYQEAAIADVAATIRKIGADSGKRPTLLGAHSFVAFRGDADGVTAPWTNLDGVIRYMELNGIGYIYVNKHIEEYPFFEALGTPEWDRRFTLIVNGENNAEGRYALYELMP